MDHLTLRHARIISALSASMVGSDECKPQIITVRNRGAYWVARAWCLSLVSRSCGARG